MGRKIKNLVDKKFNRFLVLEFKGTNKDKKSLWLCKCDCGNKKIIIGGNLIRNRSKSCGCLQKDSVTKHKMSKSKFYCIWEGIKQRCDNKKHKAYKHYGGRGIAYDLNWKEFEGFKEDMYIKYVKCRLQYKGESISIERKNVNKNYCYNNCTFIPMRLQSKNTRKNKWFKAISPEGRIFYSKNQRQFSREHNFKTHTNILDCLRGTQKFYKNWSFSFLQEG